MQLQYESETEVPEDLKESFTEFKDGDKTVWMHKDLAETKKEAFRYKGDLTQTKQKQDEIAQRLADFEKREQERKEEQEKLELEKKQKDGKHEEILEHFKQQAEQEKSELKKQLDELQNSVKSEKKAAVVKGLSAAGTEQTRAALERLIDLDLDFDDGGNIVVMMEGKATSLSIDEYKAKLPELYPSLVGESHGKGGQGKGGTGSGTPKDEKPKLSNTTQGYLANLNN